MQSRRMHSNCDFRITGTQAPGQRAIKVSPVQGLPRMASKKSHLDRNRCTVVGTAEAAMTANPAAVSLCSKLCPWLGTQVLFLGRTWLNP